MSPSTTSCKRNGSMVKRSNNSTACEDTAVSIDKMTISHNLASISPSLNESPTLTMRPTTQTPRFITLPTRTSLKRKNLDNHDAEKLSFIAKDGRSELTSPNKRRRSRRIIIDSSDEESGQAAGLESCQNAKASRASGAGASTRFRRGLNDTSDEESREEAGLGSHLNPKPSESSKNGRATSLCNIIKSLASFPTGEVAYGAELAGLPLPDIEVLNMGRVKCPYNDGQLDNVKGFARQLRDKRSGIDWGQIERTPMWYVFNQTFCET